MSTDDILLLKGNDIGAVLKGREHEIVNVVARAYEAHASGNSSLPHSTFLSFPDDQKNRIIALPAYLGDGFSVAGDESRARLSYANALRAGRGEPVVEIPGRDMRQRIHDEAVVEQRDEHGMPRLPG